MSDSANAPGQIMSLPTGGGIHVMGEKFNADLQTERRTIDYGRSVRLFSARTVESSVSHIQMEVCDADHLL
jgi:hypothetical protein